MKNSHPIPSSMLPDVLGLAILGIQIIAVFYFLAITRILPDDGFRLVFGILAYMVLAACALYVWHSSKFTETISQPVEWPAAIGGSIFLGALSFGADMIVGLIANPHLSPFEAGTKAGSPFGFPLTILLCPGLTMVAISGFIRALFTRKETSLCSKN